MERCACCGTLLTKSVVVAWRGALFCNHSCTVTFAKLTGTYDEIAKSQIIAESEEVLASDIGIRSTQAIPYLIVERILKHKGYEVYSAPHADFLYEGENVTAKDEQGAITYSFDDISTFLKRFK